MVFGNMYDIEEFRDVVGYEDLYEVSNEGRVRNKNTGKVRKPHKNSGYLVVILYKDGKQKNCLVHRLVAKAFISNPNNYPQVNHIDENKLNNNVENLEWCSAQYNTEYSQAKPVNQYDLSGNLLKRYKSTREAERQTGINSGSISDSCSGKTKVVRDKYIFKYESK